MFSGVGYLMCVVCFEFVVDCWLLVVGRRLLVVGCWLSVVSRCLLCVAVLLVVECRLVRFVCCVVFNVLCKHVWC